MNLSFLIRLRTFAVSGTLLFMTLLLASACSIHGNMKGLYSYYDQTASLNPGLIRASNAASACAFEPGDSARVYLTTASFLQSCLKDQQEAVVFIWQPNCHGSHCYSIRRLQELCREKHIDFYVVAEYYDNAKMSLDYGLERPIYGIDTKHYHTDLTSKYISRFLTELIGTAERKGNFLRFRQGVFAESFQSIEGL
jgi:hypothetical protein